MKNKNGRLSLPEKKFTTQEYDILVTKNVDLLIALERVYAAVMTHKLNCHAVAPNDTVLWEKVENIVSYE